MDKQMAVILALACVMLGVGGYLISENSGTYDLEKSSRELAQQKVALEEGDGKKPGIFATLKARIDQKFETARNQYLGEHFPKTPEGWTIHKTNHSEIVNFTLDYKLYLTLNDKGSVRGLSGLGGTKIVRTTDVAYRKGEKVIFVRLGHAQRKPKKAISNAHGWLFFGEGAKEKTPLVIAQVPFDQRKYDNEEIINLSAATSATTVVGIFGNATLAEVEQLMAGMDMFKFSGLGSTGAGSDTGLVAQQLEMEGPEDDKPIVRAKPKPSPQGNLLSGLDETPSEEEPAAAAQKEKRPQRNLLSSLLGGADKPDRKTRINRNKSEKKSGSSFGTGGNTFKSKCGSSNGAKFCSVGN